MKIQRNSTSADRAHALQLDINAACNPGVEGRVCGAHCNLVCPSCGSTACGCMCNRDCPNNSQMLSSEPEAFPIEQGIAPLVFELRRTGFFTPCWSCEGHLDHSDQLWKIPQVWFYCDSVIHLRVLADLLKNLEIRKCLTAAWTVSVTCPDDGIPETMFSLRPLVPGEGNPSLAELQADAMTISLKLCDEFKAVARRLKSAVSTSGAR